MKSVGAPLELEPNFQPLVPVGARWSPLELRWSCVGAELELGQLVMKLSLLVLRWSWSQIFNRWCPLELVGAALELRWSWVN